MKIDRITIESNEKFLRQISSEVDFNTDNYMGCNVILDFFVSYYWHIYFF